MTRNCVPSSFRDPSGFLFRSEGVLYRQVNESYRENYDYLLSSGLYYDLVEAGLLIPHQEAVQQYTGAYRTLIPEVLDFISYPYEWSFSQLKDAALVTLEIQKRALEFGMVLKDSSAYNVQFHHGKPILIDTLSFKKYRDGSAWIGYKQFCEHFLAPLALMSYKDVRLSQLLRVYLDGIPLDLTASLLSSRARLNPGLLLHIYIHGTGQAKYADKTSSGIAKWRVSRKGLNRLVDNLKSCIEGLTWKPSGSGWTDYYGRTSNYTSKAEESKARIVSEFLDRARPKSVWDMGSNTGVYSRLASRRGIRTLSIDADSACVDINYRNAVREKDKNLLPLVIDLTNPSPGIGWMNEERQPLWSRGHADMALALALVHHLAIANNLPFRMIAEFFHRICDKLVIEFVPKSDPKVKTLLANREDIFADYSQGSFEREFGRLFAIDTSVPISDSLRTVYLMSKRGAGV